MEKDTVIEVVDVSKIYYPANAVGEVGFKEIVRGLWDNVPKKGVKQVNALRGVSFEVKRGDIIGIIGKNGAGKSTLLKLLSGVSAPTFGHITIRGNVQSVLDIDTGFHPELTGRENLYVKGQISGLTKKEVDDALTSIVEFSGIGDFLDMPVKYYSSGMYLRLAFAFILRSNSDIILFDEAFSVGDVAFKEKAAQQLKLLFKQQKTVLMVSHSMNEIARFCKKLMVLKGGEVIAFGETTQVMSEYMDYMLMEPALSISYDAGPSPAIDTKNADDTSYGSNILTVVWNSASQLDISNNYGIRLVEIKATGNIEGQPFLTSEQLEITIEINISEPNAEFELSLSFKDKFDNDLFVAFSNSLKRTEWNLGNSIMNCTLPAGFFNKGAINIGLAIGLKNGTVVFRDDYLLRVNFAHQVDNMDMHPFSKYFPGPLSGNIAKWDY